MTRGKNSYSRRDFFKITGAAGAGTLLTSMGKLAFAKEDSGTNTGPGKTVPTRPYGNTGAKVSILGMGGSQSLSSKQVLLQQAIKMGVTYWDNSHSYERGKSEAAMGDYFAANPEDRKKVFLVTKSHSANPEALTKDLEGSLSRLKTDYVDMYFLHGIASVTYAVKKEVLDWVDKTKASGKIHFFGFSTHMNMAKCLTDAAKLGGIDGIMTAFNYRIMQTDDMKRAVDACEKAGIGLTAMKVIAPRMDRRSSGTSDSENEIAVKLIEQLEQKGYTPQQARLKAVWDDPRITTICSEMTNLTILEANVAAALNRNELTLGDKQLLHQYARATNAGYCAGCADICESAVNAPISTVMRYLMYANGYGNYERAIHGFRRLPRKMRQKLVYIDYSAAEKVCPHNMAIGKLMAEAARMFSILS